jgi:type IV pilus assembly protein PilC
MMRSRLPRGERGTKKMAITFTPGQLARRADFYYQLGQLTGAGLGVVGALKHLARNPPARSYRLPIQQLLRELEGGRPFGEALGEVGGWLPEFDVALLRAGEHSGRLVECLQMLREYYQERAQLARQLLAGVAYPAFLFHFAILIAPFPQLFLTGDWVRYCRQVLIALVPLYAVVAAIIYAGQSGHGESWRAFIELLLKPIPVLGSARRSLALARLSAALEALLNAGITVIEAWEMAARASGSPLLMRTVAAWRPRLEAGETPSELVTDSSQFPDIFSGQYAAGEISGGLDETLRRLQKYYQEEASRKLQALSRWLPMIVYLAVVLMIAYQIIQGWMGHFREIQNAIGP